MKTRLANKTGNMEQTPGDCRVIVDIKSEGTKNNNQCLDRNSHDKEKERYMF